MAPSSEPEWLEIGHIVAPQGLDGAVRIYPNSDFPERFLDPGTRWLRKPGHSEPEPIQLLSGRYLEGKGLYVLRLEGVATREQAEALRQTQLLVRRSDRLPIAPDEFHVADLIGLEVRLQQTGAVIGTVVDLYSAGNDLLAIELIQPQGTLEQQADSIKALPNRNKRTKKSKKAPPVLVPFVHAIVPVVDLAAGYVTVDPPPGLFPE